jgi:hypothetical protein
VIATEIVGPVQVAEVAAAADEDSQRSVGAASVDGLLAGISAELRRIGDDLAAASERDPRLTPQTIASLVLAATHIHRLAVDAQEARFTLRSRLVAWGLG